MALTPAQSRVINPILTNAARGYKNASMVGGYIFPDVVVSARGGTMVSFGKEALRQYDTARSPGSNTKRVDYGYSSTTFTLTQHSLEGKVPFEDLEEANAVPGIDLGAGTVMLVQDIIALRAEIAMANLATTAGNYGSGNKTTLTGTSQWSDLVNSDPIGDVETAKNAIRSQVGKLPNVMVIGYSVFKALKSHSKIIDRIKYTGRDVPTEELLSSLFGVKVYVGQAIKATDADVVSDVWGKFAVLCYSELRGLADRGAPSFGYNYHLSNYPIVEQPYQDRSAKSWIYPITDEMAPVIVGADAGYLISGAVA
jgi:hypothetical protein